MSLRRLAAAFCAAIASGCATLEAPFRDHLESGSPLVRECAEWYRALDQRVDAAGVRDAQDTRVPGFPYLRVSRLLAALRPAAAANDPALNALGERMLALDLEARRFEIMNLAPEQLGDLPDDGFGLRLALQRTQQCGRLLQGIDFAEPGAREALLQRAGVPDDYVVRNRILGLYALTRLAFAAGVKRYEEARLAAFRRELAAPPGATVVRHAPSPGLPLPRARVAAILERAAVNPLGIPEPGDSELQEILAAYAPSLEVEVAADYDRFGALRWLRGGEMPAVDASQLVVYGHSSFTRYRDKVLLQLVYTIWFPERPPQSDGDILAGKLDGITWRVTLAPDGEPLIYDAIHPCGCFHLFFPTPQAAALPAPDRLQEWMFSPQSLPRIAEGERPLLRIASGTHYIERVSLVRGSERPERFVFWPMGIRSAGAMRQWGRHATAFVGRRHFDDADLFEKRFRFDLP